MYEQCTCLLGPSKSASSAQLVFRPQLVFRASQCVRVILQRDHQMTYVVCTVQGLVKAYEFPSISPYGIPRQSKYSPRQGTRSSPWQSVHEGSNPSYEPQMIREKMADVE